MVPVTVARSGPAVVVNFAERQFSGSKLFLNTTSGELVPTASPVAASWVAGVGREILKSLMIWFAIRRRSEERSGASGLICRGSQY